MFCCKHVLLLMCYKVVLRAGGNLTIILVWVFDIQYCALLLDDLEKRKRLRQKKARDERRRERRIEIEENKKQGKCKS